MQKNLEYSFPGATFALIRHNSIESDCIGKTNLDTLYDVASLTKVIVTNTLIGFAVQEGKLDFNDRLSEHLTEYSKLDVWENTYKPLTIRELLTHQSALKLPNIKDKLFSLYRSGCYPEAYQTCLFNLQNTEITDELLDFEGSEISKRISYSNINFILLGQLLERLYEKPLDVLARQKVFDPLKMTASHFNRISNAVVDLAKYAPTEMTEWRGLVQGYVHDETAFFLDGIAGNAGMFGNIHDVSYFAQMVLNNGMADGRQFISKNIVDNWFKPQNEKRTIGFEIYERAIRHTGFTGTFMLIDRDRDLAIVILSNRIRYGRKNRHIYDMYEEVWNAYVE